MEVEQIDMNEELLDLLRTSSLPISDLEKDSAKVQFFGVRMGSILAGVIGLETYGGTAILRSLAVKKSFRKNEIGLGLVSYTEKIAAESGVKDLYLLTENAAGYFERLGYKVVKREDLPETIRKSTQFSEICPATAVVMVKSLPDRMAGADPSHNSSGVT